MLWIDDQSSYCSGGLRKYRGCPPAGSYRRLDLLPAVRSDGDCRQFPFRTLRGSNTAHPCREDDSRRLLPFASATARLAPQTPPKDLAAKLGEKIVPGLAGRSNGGPDVRKVNGLVAEDPGWRTCAFYLVL